MRRTLVLGFAALLLPLGGCVDAARDAPAAMPPPDVAALTVTGFLRVEGPWNATRLQEAAVDAGFTIDPASPNPFATHPLDAVVLFANAPENDSATWLLMAKSTFPDPPICTRADLEAWGEGRLDAARAALADAMTGMVARGGWNPAGERLWGVDVTDSAGAPVVLPERCAPPPAEPGAPAACASHGNRSCA